MATGNRMNVGTLFVELLLDDEELGKGTARAQKRLSAFADTLRSVAAKVDATLTAALTRAAMAAGAVATAAAVVGAGFEKQMSKVAAVAGETGEKGAKDLAAMTEEARRIGKETQFSATEAAYGMEALAQAGMDTKEILSATAEAMNLAGATGVDLDTATSLVAASLTQFKLSAGEAGRVADVFTMAAQSSLLTVEDLTVAMRYAGTAGATLGYTIEETTAAVAMFRNMGLTGEQSGTNFRAMMESLANPTKRASEVLAGLNITLDEVNPAMHSFDEIVARLSKSGMDLGHSYAVFGSIAGGNIMSLIEDWRVAGDGANAYRDILSDLNAAHGVSARTFAAMADNVAGRWDQLKSAAEEFLLVLFEMGKGPLKKLLEGLAERVNFLSTTFAKGATDGASKLDALVDGTLALVDAAILLIPRLEEIAAAMVAALVVSKGVQYAIALVELAAAFGVNLPAAIMKAVVAMRAMSAAQLAFTATALGAVIAGLVLLASTITRVADSFSGAARAAREMEGAQRGLREFAEASEDEQKRVAASLASTKKEISARIAAGEAVSDLERALLSYTDAQAFAEIQAGKAVAYTDRIRFASEMTTEELNDFSGALRDNARDAGKTADELEYLAGQFTTTMDPVFFETISGGKHIDEVMQGGVEGLTDLGAAMEQAGVFSNMFSGPLSKARELTGLSIHTFEDLTAAIARLRAEQDAASKRADNLGTSLALNVDAANQARKTAIALAGATALETDSAVELSAAQKELARDAKALAKEEEKAAKAREEAGNGFGNWLETWSNDAATGQELLDDLNEEIRNLPANLAKVGAAAQQTVPAVVEDFNHVGEGIRSVARDLEQLRDDMEHEPFEKLREGVGRLGEEIKRAGGFWGWFGDRMDDLADKARALGPVLLDLAKRGLVGLGKAALNVAGQIRSGIESVILPITGLVRPLFDLQSQFGSAFSEENETNKPDDAVAKMRAVQGTREAAANVAAFVKGFAAALPAMLKALADELPGVLTAIIEAIPRVIDAIIEALPRIVDALVEAIPKLIKALVDKLPGLVDAILQQLPRIIEALGDGVVLILGMLPDLVTAVLSNLPAIITALVNQLPKIVDALVLAVPEIIVAIVEQLPYIVFALIQAAPKIVWAFVTLMPRVVWGIIKALPEIVTAFWTSFKDIWPDFLAWAGELAKAIGQGIMDIVTLGLFKTKDEKEGKSDDKGFLWGLFDKKPKGDRAASGIEYAPRTMATVIEPGEAVLDALANQARLRGEMNAPGPIPAGGPAGATSLSLGFMFDGRLMDEVLVSGLGKGRAPGLKRVLRSASGTRPGFSRGRFQPFSG